jgi:sugar lactone lactonase YvrE
MDTSAFTTGTDQSEWIPVGWRISPIHYRVISFILVVLAGYLALTAPPAFAQSPCPAGVTPYALPSASDRACGLQLIPRSAVTPLPDGGKRTEYLLPNGEITSSTTPPPSFDAAAASPVELQEYGIPPEPAATSPEYPKWRAMIEKGIHGVEPPAELAISTPESDAASGTTSPSSASLSSSEPSTGTTTWSGYFDWNGKGSYTHTAAYFTEPEDNNSTPCTKPHNQGSIWGGIGGWETGNNGPLGQDGTVQHQEKYGEDEAFYEVLPAVEARTGFKSTPKAYFLADTQWTGSKYSFYFYNYANGESKHFELGGAFNGKTADYIAERQKGTNLYNFGTIHFQGFTNGKAFHEKGYSTEHLTMANANEVNAEPSQVYKNYEFMDTWRACAGESLANEEEQSGSGEGAEPAAITGSGTSIGEHEATLGGTVNPEGSVTHYQFEYGTEAGNYGSSTPDVSAGSGLSAVPVSTKVIGLQPDTTYHYRIIANSATGISAGNEATFTTTGHPPLPPPTVMTEGASGIGATTATLEGTVNPNGLDTHYYFEYGKNSNLFESFAPALPGKDAGSGSLPVKVTVGLTELTSHVTYCYRLVASNSTGTSYGVEKEFSTLFSPPVYSSEFGEGGQLKSATNDAIDGDGNIWVVSPGNNDAEEFSPSGTLIRTVGTELASGDGITINRMTETVYIANRGSILEYSTGGAFIGEFSSKGSQPGQVDDPTGIAIDSSGNVWVVDRGNYRIEKFSSTGAFIAAYGSSGTGNGQYEDPQGIAIDSANHVYITDQQNDRVEELSAEGVYLGQIGSPGNGNGEFLESRGISIDLRTGNIFVVDSGHERVEVFTNSGTYLGQFGSNGLGEGQFVVPVGIAIGSSGDVYVVDSHAKRVTKFIQDGC